MFDRKISFCKIKYFWHRVSRYQKNQILKNNLLLVQQENLILKIKEFYKIY